MVSKCLFIALLLAAHLYPMVHSAPSLIDYTNIHAFLDKLLSPKNCTGSKYAEVRMGGNGGFASQFQMAASHWMRAAAITNFNIPVIVAGSITRYSEGPSCKHVNGDYTCYFLPLSECQQVLTRTGVKVEVDYKKMKSYNDALLPPQFSHVGIAYWWGIVQERMFRLQVPVRNYIVTEGSRMNNGLGFPGLSLASLAPDWRLNAKQKNNSPLTTLVGIHVRHGDKKSDGFVLHGFEETVLEVHKILNCAVPQAKADGSCWIKSTKDALQRIPVFVASDDGNVLTNALRMGFLAHSHGVSQTTEATGMMVSLRHKPEMSYNASLEIIRDVLFLSRCSTLVGIAASQVFRMAVALSNATGILDSATAMDSAQIPRVMHLSRMFGVPFVETFNMHVKRPFVPGTVSRWALSGG